MGIGGPKLLLLATCVVIKVSIGLLIAGAVSDKWFVLKETTVTGTEYYQGLLKECFITPFGTTCTKRDSILKFEGETDSRNVQRSSFRFLFDGKVYDTILLSLILSVGFSLFGLITSYTMFCSNGSNSWRIGAILTGILTSIGVCIAFGGLGYSESLFDRRELAQYKHGWSPIIGWVGAVAQLFGAILAFILICIKPRPDFSNQGHVVYSHNNSTNYVNREYNMTETRPNYENKGYQGNEPSSREQYLGYNNYRNQEREAQRQQAYDRQQRQQEERNHKKIQQQYAYHPKSRNERHPSYDNTGYHIR